MKLHDLATGAWAITTQMMEEVQRIYAAHLLGEKIDIHAAEKRLGVQIAQPKPTMEVEDGVAVIPVEGVLSPKMNLLSQISGGTSYQLIGSMLSQALADPEVRGVILSIDSPGGTVVGLYDLADQILDARGQKPILGHTSGDACSAAYMIAACCDQFHISSDAVHTGSIGVVGIHRDVSAQESAAGIKTTEIFAGRYKTAGSKYKPLDEFAKTYMQEQVDYLYTAFVSRVAQARGMTTEQTLAVADGRVYIGKQAIEAGLVDGVSTLQALIDKLSAGEAGAIHAGRSSAQSKTNTQEATMPDTPTPAQASAHEMTAESFQATHPAIFEAIRSQAHAAGLAAGALAERERIQAIEALALPGHDALVTTMKWDGKTTGPMAAEALLKAEKTARAGNLAQIHAEAPPPVPHAAAPKSDSSPKPDFMAMVQQAVDAGVKKADAIKAVAEKHPEAHKAFIAASQKNGGE